MRRPWLVAFALLSCALFPLAFWSVGVEPDRLVVVTTEIAPPRWPAELDGLRVVALSDLHAGSPHVDLAKLARVAALANEQRPDLVVLLGDYVIHGVVGGSFITPEAAARELKALRARIGVYAVLGNHDHWLGAAQVRQAFAAAGIPVIDDEAVSVGDEGRELWLLGIRDVWSGWPDVPALMRKVPEGRPLLALTHNPDIFPFLPPAVDLLLAGHTHGGQVSLPLLGAPLVPSSFGQRYARGSVVEDGRHLFVTPGIGTSILPVRFRVPPEVSLVILRRRGGQGG
jgi:predicted MPP superfamily phosphohydrolase